MNYLKFFSITYYIGMLLVLIGVLTQLSGSFLGVYLLIAGILPIVGVRLHNQLVASRERKRINSILLISSLFLVLAIVTILFEKNYWIVFILITAVLDTYASFRRLS